jgi:hypothetical protein
VQGEIAAVGAEFQDRNEAAFSLEHPDGGCAIRRCASFDGPRRRRRRANYSTAVLPFNMGMATGGLGRCGRSLDLRAAVRA